LQVVFGGIVANTRYAARKTRYRRREAGYTIADVAVSKDLDEGAMIRVYARENATQRGNTGTATAGMIASAVRFLGKAILTGTVHRNSVHQ
jgi:hypothetical protein